MEEMKEEQMTTGRSKWKERSSQ